MRRIIVSLCVLTLTACGGSNSSSESKDEAPTATPTTASSTPAPITPSPAAPSPEVALRKAVQGYSDAFLRGEIAAYDDYFSKGCKAKVDRNYFLGLLIAASDRYGKALPIRSFDAEINGTSADVSYTFDDPDLAQSHETWVLEGSQWRTTDCG